MTQIAQLSPLWQALLATCFTYGVTAVGAMSVFCTAHSSRRLLNFTLAFSAGVMLAASFWSLLNPAIDLCRTLGTNPWLTSAVGFLAGGGFLLVSDLAVKNIPALESKDSSYRRNLLLAGAVALHNIPEGLAVGVAFGCAALGIGGLNDAWLLAVGIGLQNFPEGACVSLPLYQSGVSRGKAFFWGQLSAVAEPIAGVLGALFALKSRQMLPLALCFSAGAMVYVVCSELVPAAFTQNKYLAAVGLMIGFTAMTVLDVALG